MAPISRNAFWKARLAGGLLVVVLPHDLQETKWKPTLLVLAEFSFQCANVLDAMFEYHALRR